MKMTKHTTVLFSALFGLTLASSGGCATVSLGPLTPRRCLRGPAPSVGRPVPDEVFALMRRELDRARKAPPFTRARILEGLPRLFPDVSDLAREPTCAPELVAWMEKETFAQEPLAFSRLAIARVRAAGSVGDTTDVMEAKAAFLIRIASTDDGAIAPYEALPQEPGPLPDKAFLRHLALAHLAWSSLRHNVPAVLPFLKARLEATSDPIERKLLEGALARPMVDPHLGLRGEPAGGRPGRMEALARVQVLEGELERLHFAPARCHVLRTIATWLPEDEAAARFDGLVAPIFDAEGKLRLRSETHCRIGVALELEGAALASRLELLRQLLALGAEEITPYDFGGDEAHPALAYDTNPMTVKVPAAAALGRHPEWALEDPKLQTWLIDEAAAPLVTGSNGNLEEVHQLLLPVHQLLLGFHATKQPGARLEWGRAILLGFLSSIEGVLEGEAPHSLWAFHSLRDRILALREHAPSFGVETELQALLARVRKAWGAEGSLPVVESFRLELLEAASVD